MNAQEGRLHFKLRTPLNCLIVGGAFALFALLVSPFEWAWFADIVVAALLYYIFFYILDKRAIGIHCPHCLQYIATNTPWRCGLCGKENLNVDDYPFLNQCEHCPTVPKSYVCHHSKCGELIFFGKDQDPRNPAMSLTAPPPPAPPVPKASDERREKKEGLIHEIEMAELASKLDEINQRKNLRQKTPSEEIEESFTRHHARNMGTHEFARRQKTVNAEKFKDDPEMLERSNESIDDWVRNRV